MKRLGELTVMLLVTALLATSLAGCFGGFNLTRRVYQWNQQQFEDKWTRTVVMWAMLIVPVYYIAGVGDFVLVNTIEFWTGENPVPLAMEEGQPQIIAIEGHEYEMTRTGDRIELKQLDGDNTATLLFDALTGAWTLESGDDSFKIAQVNGDELELFAPNGESMAVTQ